jgi:hypothetical protein
MNALYKKTIDTVYFVSKDRGEEYNKFLKEAKRIKNNPLNKIFSGRFEQRTEKLAENFWEWYSNDEMNKLNTVLNALEAENQEYDKILEGNKELIIAGKENAKEYKEVQKALKANLLTRGESIEKLREIRKTSKYVSSKTNKIAQKTQKFALGKANINHLDEQSRLSIKKKYMNSVEEYGYGIVNIVGDSISQIEEYKNINNSLGLHFSKRSPFSTKVAKVEKLSKEIAEKFNYMRLGDLSGKPKDREILFENHKILREVPEYLKPLLKEEQQEKIQKMADKAKELNPMPKIKDLGERLAEVTSAKLKNIKTAAAERFSQQIM